MKLDCLLLVFVLFTYMVARRMKGKSRVWVPIKNIDSQVIFLVVEYDLRTGQKLNLEKVIKAETRFVMGT